MLVCPPQDRSRRLMRICNSGKHLTRCILPIPCLSPSIIPLYYVSANHKRISLLLRQKLPPSNTAAAARLESSCRTTWGNTNLDQQIELLYLKPRCFKTSQRHHMCFIFVKPDIMGNFVAEGGGGGGYCMRIASIGGREEAK